MKFKKFNSIDGPHRQKTMDYITSQGFGDMIWSVNEKIHGSNISIWYDGKIIKAGKRSGFIGENENFYSYEKVLEDNRERVIALYKYLAELRKTDSQDKNNDRLELTIYGELFGGNYPHPKVAKISNATSVQKGIYYSPDNHFYAFDIMINGKYLSVDYANRLFERFEFLYAKELFRGTLDKCLKYPNDGISNIYKEFGLPEIEPGMLGKDEDGNDILNIMEGVVLRPINNAFFNNGSRVILKNKNTKWKEKNNKNKKKPKPPAEPLPEIGQFILDEVSLYLSENRLRNVISKIGEVTDKDFGKLLGMFVRDAIIDYRKDGGKEHWNKMDKPLVKRVNKLINTHSAMIIRKNFVNIIDNTF